MKSVAAIALALVACASPSAEQELADLSADAAPCGDIDDSCSVGTDPNTVVACMNAALSNGTLAATAWSSSDTADFFATANVFTDGGRVRVFDTVPDDYSYGPDTITEEPTCAGPFSLSTHTICLDIHILDIAGCPPGQ